MASLGESSLGSVPIDIAALHDHLLQNGQPSADAQTPRPRPDMVEHDRSHTSQSLSQPSGATPSHVAAITAPGSALQVPQLTPSKSAPADLDAMVRRTPSQDAMLARAVTFNAYAGGDTQPMESQVYRDYTESMTRSSGTTPKKTILHYDANAIHDENTYGTTSVNGRTQHTMDQGDDGFVDLDGAWQPEDSPGAKSATSGIEELLAGPETQSQNNFGANGSFAPRTPGLAGHQRTRSGDIPTSATDASRKTPAGFSQMFGMTSKLPMLSATQLFDQTQALSSPTADAVRSDPVIDRPSPILNTHSDFSPNVVSSSPMLMMRNPPASTAGEPRDIYTSMRESQERRAARLRQDLELQNRFGPDAIAERLEDDEDDTQQRRLDRQWLHRVLSDQATDEWSKYRAPSRPGHRSVSAHKRTTTIDLVTPGTVRKHGRVQFDLLDDEQETDNDDDMEVDLPAEVEDIHDGEGVPDVEGEEDNYEDNDIYDEYSQQVLRSQRDPEDEEDDNDEHEDQGDENGVEDEEGSDHGSSAERDETGHEDEAGGADEVLDEAAAGTQPAVADSQPERLEAQRSLLMEQPLAQPVTSSIIPGSQYAGLTSQELARHSNRVPNSSTLSQQFAQEVSKSQTRDSRVPSSPPVPEVSSEEREDARKSPTRQRPLVESDAGRDLLKGVRSDRREIPESDQPDRHYREEQESAQGETIFETAGESNTVAPYSTAQTHLDESAHTPEKPKLVKELSKVEPSQQSIPTPLRAAGVRRFADITADPSPPEFSAESQLDMDAIMGNVISMDDQNFMDVLSSPPSEKPTKRRRLLPQDSSKRRSRLPSMELAGSEPVDENLLESSSPVKAANVEPTEPAPVTAAPAVVEALRSSSQKANDPPSATPEEAPAPDTPESVRRREEAGSKAASQLLSARPSFATKVTKKASHTKGDRKSSLTRAVERKPVSRRVSSKLKKVVEKATDETPSEATALPNDAAIGQTAEAIEPQTAEAEVTMPTQASTIEVPERVLARFTGVSYNAYYPATWLSTVADGRSYVVRFDDSTVTTVDKKDVRSLEFRIDDAVRIDFEGFRSKTWLIKSFGRKARDEQDRANGMDIYGHVTLNVQAKVTGRNSMPAASAAPQGEGGIEEVMVTNVKITHNMITHFADRDFYPPDSKANAAVNNRTPSAKGRSFDAETPSRSTRRAAASTTKSTVTEPSKLREESVASMSEVADAGMFEGMAFAISYASNEAEKFDVTRLIRRNGGLILEQGFDELFVQPQLDEQTTPTKRSAKAVSTAQSGIESGSLKLKPEYEKLGFIALIADKHSRRAKYMQALALDLPTLSGRWIIDSFDSSRNVAFPSSPRPWTRYLLPAGESSYLGGAIRSRTLQYYNPASAKLPSTVASRALLLEGAGVLLVAPKKGKGTWERRKAYAFLTLALGAGSVRRVADLAEAKKLLASDVEKQKWSWVYVDDDAGEAAKVLFGAKGSTGASRKRKRNEGPQMCVEGMQGRVRVVGDEFVVQSLILGALVD